MFAAFLGSSLLVVAFPRIRHCFTSVSTGEISWILNDYTIVFGDLLIPHQDGGGSVLWISRGVVRTTSTQILAVWSRTRWRDLVTTACAALDCAHDLAVPPASDATRYAALLESLSGMRGITGRKAIILVSTGVDTFSKTSYE